MAVVTPCPSTRCLLLGLPVHERCEGACRKDQCGRRGATTFAAAAVGMLWPGKATNGGGQTGYADVDLDLGCMPGS